MGLFYSKNNYRFEQTQIAKHSPKKPGYKVKDTKTDMELI